MPGPSACYQNMKNLGLLFRFLILFSALAPSLAFAKANPGLDLCRHNEVSGLLRTYYFSKLYGSNKKTDQHAFAAAGILNFRTQPFLDGVCVGASLFHANSLGLNSSDSARVDTTLMGLGHSLTALGQAYIQWQHPGFMIRGGDQVINTPWMGPRDSRALPQTFQGVYAAALPAKKLKFEAMRIYAWKSRTSDDYFRDNLYYPTYFENDDLFGTKKILPKSAAEAPGTLAFGAHYLGKPLSGQLWYYDFYRFAKMFYGDGTYLFKRHGEPSPFISAQYAHEWSGANNYFQRYGATLFTKSGTGGVNATLYGIRLGLKKSDWLLQASYNRLENNPGAFGGGALVSPYGNYTAMYASFMTDNLLSFGPGDAYAIGGSYWALGHRFKFTAAAAQFRTTYNSHPHAVYLDASYHPAFLKGLSIRDRIAINNGLPSFDGGYYINNRFMVQYLF